MEVRDKRRSGCRITGIQGMGYSLASDRVAVAKTKGEMQVLYSPPAAAHLI